MEPSQNSRFQMPSLPEEIITEILLKLPVESLLKFRCVSKSWLSLISSPDFVKAHLLLSASDNDYTHHRVMFYAGYPNPYFKDCSLSALLRDSVTETFDLDYPGKRPYCGPRIVGSFNGLICIAIITNRLCNFFLWNPSIRKYYALPDYSLDATWGCLEDSRCVYGFGYDEFQDDYKVVGIFSRSKVIIFSLNSNSWKRIHGFQGSEVLNQPGKLVNRKLHWIDNDVGIVSIDLADEKWAEVEKPRYIKRNVGFVLGVLGNHLSLFFTEWDHVDFWVMKEYGVNESWIKQLTIKCDFLESMFHSIIFMSNEGEILLQGSRFTKYNPKDDSIKYLKVTKFTPCFEAVMYVKSQVWPF